MTFLQNIFKKKPEPTIEDLMQSDWKFGGGFGDCIALWDPEQIRHGNLDKDLVEVYGFKWLRTPQVGETILLECEKSWIQFRFAEVRRMSDPPDQFFGKVKACAQVMK